MRDDRAIDVKRIKDAFGAIKEEFAEHLNAINENTNEIRENYDYICEVDAKIEKLSEKIDEISFFLKDLKSQKDLVITLSPHEQKVFLALYLEHSPLSFFEIVKRTQLPAALVEKILMFIVDKDIPIITQKMGDESYYILDSKFKEKQARQNIVKIDEAVTRSLFVKDLNSYM
ncbi:MAG: hypothetical protein ACLFPQ_05590 [Candidatus Woesearchaeota archaeon]